MDRRLFLQNVAGTLVAASLPGGASAARTARQEKMIGIQIGAVSFADEGVSRVLDECQESASVNTLFVATFTYGRGIAGRQVPGQPLPDHGTQKYDTDTFFGGSYTRINPKYYTDTAFKDFRAPDLGSFDVLEQVIPEAKKRGIKTICWYEDVFRRNLPNIDKLQEVELSGGRAATLCFNNPDYLFWLQDIAEDWSRSYDIDGIMWGSERQGALSMCSVQATVVPSHRPPHASASSAARKRVARASIPSGRSKASLSSKALCQQPERVSGSSTAATSNSGG